MIKRLDLTVGVGFVEAGCVTWFASWFIGTLDEAFSLYAREMDEAAIGDAHMRGSATVALTRIMLAGQPRQPRDQPHRECPRPASLHGSLADNLHPGVGISLDGRWWR